MILGSNRAQLLVPSLTCTIYESLNRRQFSIVKAAGDKLLMNKFIRQNFGGGRTLKNFRS